MKIPKVKFQLEKNETSWENLGIEIRQELK